ncbi:MAG: FkbM family methyltransferase [Cyanobacteria bacterium P01_D01_bin.105]
MSYIKDIARRLFIQSKEDSVENLGFYNETLNDRWILECIYPDKYNGYFVEAGACNGKFGSCCYLLEKERGWKGLCIEPNDDWFPQLVETRPNSICENVCVAATARQVTYIKGTGGSAPYLGGIKENLKKFKHGSKAILKKGEEVKKNAVPLATLLKKHNAPKAIDYAAFDIEGSELEVLANFPFDDYYFSALSLECDGYIWDDITKILLSKGYQEVKNPFNTDKPWERYWLHHTML